MSADFAIGFAVGAIFATCMFTLGQDLILKMLKLEVKLTRKQQSNREVKS